MSEYEWADSIGDRMVIDDIIPGGRTLTAFETFRGTEHRAAVRLPTDPAELHKLVEAILGRKVAAVIYEDELPQITAGKTVLDVYVGAAPMALLGVEQHLSMARSHVARLRHIEARDAAAKELERAEEERVEAKAEELSRRWHEAESGHPLVWAHVYEGYKQGWRAVARHVLAGEEAGR